MSFPRYPKYKASGVAWLGDVPEHWGVWKLTHAFDEIGSGTTPKTDNREYYENGTHSWVITGDLNDGDLYTCEKKITSRALSDHTSLRVYPAGSVVIAMYGATIGKLAILKFPASVNQACCVFAGKLKIEYKFLFFWLLGFRPQIISLASGGGQPNINQDILRSLRVACPDLPEQTAIVEFLDRETAKVDALVAEQQRLMELLKEKRHSVISHAVTKGLNPRAPMKSSGIEWIGDVPEHWGVWKLTHAFDEIGSGTTPKTDNREYYENGTHSWVITGDLNDGDLYTCEKKITSRALSDHTSLRVYPAGSVVIAMYGATIGKLAILKFPASVNQACCVFAGKLKIEYKFLFFWLLGFRPQIISLASGGGQPNINQDILRSLRVACPDLPEQTAIVEFLDRETAKFDTLTAEAQHAIDLLQERRATLISAAVTGQIDVRQRQRN